MNNNLNGIYGKANMSDPLNNYNFNARIEILTWEDIEYSELLDIYKIKQDPESGIDMSKLRKYVVPILSVKSNVNRTTE